MDSFYANSSQFTLDLEEYDETTNADLSLKMNRSRMLLSEFGNDSTNTPNRSMQQQQRSQLNSPSLVQKPKSQHQSLLRRTQIQNSEPIPSQQSSIYAQFKLDTNKKIDEDGNLVELVTAYAGICTEHIQFMQEKIQSLKMSRQKQDQLTACTIELDDLEKEKNLWHLIHNLYLDEQSTQQSDDNNAMDTDTDYPAGFDETLILRRLLKKNPLLRKIKLVIDWLESIAAQSKNLDLVKQKIGEFQEKCSSWEHTLHYLKNANSFNKQSSSNREFVDELDPDAPVRQKRPLHDIDQEDEYKLMEYVYAFVRAGDLEQAQEFLFKVGQSWRAATLEGGKLYGDKNYGGQDDGMGEEEVMLNEGNGNRDIWRLVVQRMIKDEHFSPYEKAAYASLGGFVGPILPVCRTYMDFIWAYFKALYNNIIETEISQKMSTLRPDFANVPYDNEEDYFFNSINKSSAQASLPTIVQVFERIKVLINNSGEKNANGSKSDAVMSKQLVKNLRMDAQSPFSVILKHVIMSGLDGFRSGTNDLMEFLKTMVTSNEQNGLLVRFSSHLALFYRAASFQIKDDTFIEIIDTYSEYLIHNQYREIIAYYVSQLPTELQINRYSKFLQTITDNKVRQLLLKLAKERNMNVQAITQNIVDLLSRKSSNQLLDTTTNLPIDETGLSTTAFLGKTSELFTFRTGQVLTEEDRTRINAIDWICYDSVQRFKLLEYANLTMRHFLFDRQNFEATQSIYAKVPKDALNVVLGQYNFNTTIGQSIEANFQQMIDNLPMHVTNTIKEYLCFKEYIEAVNLYNDWFDFFHKDKPIKPMPKFDLDQAQLSQQQSGMDKSNVFAERISYDYQLKQYEDLLVRWNSKAKIYCEKARSKFMGLLKFPFGGWMHDVPINTDQNDLNEMDQDEVEIDARRIQMKALGKLYLPNVCFVLVDMLGGMGMNRELIKMSDLIASESYRLYELFEGRQWQCLVSRLADASICLMDEGGDYMGY